MNWKSVWAVFAGVLFIIVVTTLVDIVLGLVGLMVTWNLGMGPKW